MDSFSLTVAAPPQRLFAYLVDPRRRPEWQRSLRSVEVLDDGPPRLHTRWVDHTVVGARPRLRIVELRPPADGVPGVWREAGDWRGLHAELGLTVAPTADGGTALSGAVEITGTRWWAPVGVLLRALAPRAVVADLRRAGRLVGSG